MLPTRPGRARLTPDCFCRPTRSPRSDGGRWPSKRHHAPHRSSAGGTWLNRSILPTWDNRPTGLALHDLLRDGEQPFLTGNHPGAPSGSPGRGPPLLHRTAKGRPRTPSTGTEMSPRPDQRRGGTLIHGTGDLHLSVAARISSAPTSTTATGTPCSILSSAFSV